MNSLYRENFQRGKKGRDRDGEELCYINVVPSVTHVLATGTGTIYFLSQIFTVVTEVTIVPKLLA